MCVHVLCINSIAELFLCDAILKYHSSGKLIMIDWSQQSIHVLATVLLLGSTAAKFLGNAWLEMERKF